MVKKVFLISIILLSALAFSQQNDKNKDVFKPHGSPIVRAFINYNTDFENVAAIELTRGYLGYKYEVNEKYSLKIIYDVANPHDGGKIEQSGYVKNAILQYKHKKIQWLVGIIPTKQFKYQENFWRYRYLLKSYQDEYGMNSGADLGASIDYKIFEKNECYNIVFVV
jgi:hypothetical protein